MDTNQLTRSFFEILVRCNAVAQKTRAVCGADACLAVGGARVVVGDTCVVAEVLV